MSSTTPPGWYPDNSNPGQLRYWDGTVWTEHLAPAQAPAAPAHPGSQGVPATTMLGVQTPLPPQQNWFLRHKVLTVVLALVLVGMVASALGGGAEDGKQQVAAETNVDSSASDSEDDVVEEASADETTTAPKPKPKPKPAQSIQSQFVAIVESGMDAAEDASNEIQVVQARKQRGTALCSLLPESRKVQGWTGELEEVSTELGGDSAVLSIRLTDDVAVQTWNNSLSDMGGNTLIKPSSPLYAELGTLEEGDKVTFSGEFIREPGNCVQEQSMIDENGMLTPDFSFKFASASKR